MNLNQGGAITLARGAVLELDDDCIFTGNFVDEFDQTVNIHMSVPTHHCVLPSGSSDGSNSLYECLSRFWASPGLRQILKPRLYTRKAQAFRTSRHLATCGECWLCPAELESDLKRAFLPEPVNSTNVPSRTCLSVMPVLLLSSVDLIDPDGLTGVSTTPLQLDALGIVSALWIYSDSASFQGATAISGIPFLPILKGAFRYSWASANAEVTPRHLHEGVEGRGMGGQATDDGRLWDGALLLF